MDRCAVGSVGSALVVRPLRAGSSSGASKAALAAVLGAGLACLAVAASVNGVWAFAEAMAQGAALAA